MIISAIDCLGRIQRLSSFEEADALLETSPREYRIVVQETPYSIISNYKQ